MTKEEAYEKLELPVGTDPHIVRQKFQQMHNEFQVQIDGAFREDMRQKLQTRLMELEEARKLLLGSEKADDSGSLPHTEKTFEQKRTEEAKAHTTQLTIQQALALFGLTEHQDVDQIEQHIASHIANLEQHLSTAPLQTAKELYQKEIDKATSAKKVINKWLDKRKKEKSQREEPQQQEPTQQEQAAPTYTPTPAKQKSKTGQFIGIAAAVIVVLAGFYFLSNRDEKPDSPIETAIDARQDSIMWQSASTGNSEATYQLYLKEYPEGIFAQVAKDSLVRISERATAQTSDATRQQEVVTPTPQPQTDNASARKKQEHQSQKSSPPSTVNTNSLTANTDNRTDWRSKYDEVIESDFTDFLKVKKNGKYGYVNKNGDVIISPNYDGLWNPDNRLGRVVGEKNGKYGLINLDTGEEITSFIYGHIHQFSEGLAKFSKDKAGYMDINGNEVIPARYNNVWPFYGLYAIVQKDWQYGVIDKNQNTIIPFGKYKIINNLSGGRLNYTIPNRFKAQLKDNNWILINEKDEFLKNINVDYKE